MSGMMLKSHVIQVWEPCDLWNSLTNHAEYESGKQFDNPPVFVSAPHKHPANTHQAILFYSMLALAPQLGWHIDIFMYAFQFNALGRFKGEVPSTPPKTQKMSF